MDEIASKKPVLIIGHHVRRQISVGTTWPSWPWAILAVVAIIDLIWLALSPAVLTRNSWIYICSVLAIANVAVWSARFFSRKDLFYVLLMGLAFTACSWPVLRLFNYLSMTTALPWADPLLSDWDGSIGFDWMAYLAFVDQYPSLMGLMDWAYTSLDGYSVYFYVAIACLAGRRERCFEFLALFIVIAVFCMVVGMFFPARAAMIYYAPDLSSFNYVNANIGIYHIDILLALRSDPVPVLDLMHMPGLVTFPSFHTAMGVMLIYVCRGNIAMLVASLIINLLMIAATPLFGSHYLIDVIAGVIATLIGIFLFRQINRKWPYSCAT
jgi:hypothetical protein